MRYCYCEQCNEIHSQRGTVEHLLSAANHVFLAIDELEEAGWTVCMPKLQRIFRHILQLIAILDERS